MRQLTIMALAMIAIGFLLSAVGTAMLLATQLSVAGVVILVISVIIRMSSNDR